MLQALILTVLALLPGGGNTATQEADWAWFRSTSIGTSWWMTEGRAQVTGADTKFEARLYDKADPKFLRLTVWGSTVNGTTRVRVRVEESDREEFALSGQLRRVCWANGGGRETLLLSDGTEVVGLVRELDRSVACKPV